MQQSKNRNSSEIKIYPESVNRVSGNQICMANQGMEDFLLVDVALGFSGEEFTHQGKTMVKACLNHENANKLRALFPWTAPAPVLKNERTFGMGDRLGNATAGHIQAVRKYEGITPVLAQQSMRELNLTGRTYLSVLDDVSFAVFRCGYKGGFGADGDHLKTEAEVQNALESGFTMITLDCSEHIRNEIYSMSDKEIDDTYEAQPILEDIYLNKQIKIGKDAVLDFNKSEFKRMTLIYNEATKFARHIFEKFIKNHQSEIDFEISIDETLFPTAPNQHYFVASELIRQGVRVSSLAPRFCGDFQKGIEYIGDLDQFEKEFELHARIADHFDYKISVHSGSDKFSVYPIVKQLTNGRFHIKTSGTSWLEAMRTISILDSGLFREIHKYALTIYDEALKYYHITSDFTKIPDIDELTDEELTDLFINDAERQLIHICYGLILNHKSADGSFVFRDRLFKTWKDNEAFYFGNLEAHIGRHLHLVY